MLGALDLLVARGRDDLRVVRYRCVRVWRNYQLLETLGFSCRFQRARGRHGGRPSPVNDEEPKKARHGGLFKWWPDPD